MPIEAQCGSCGRLLRAPDSAAGRRAKCPACGEAVRIPQPEEPYEDEVYDAEEISGFDSEFSGSTSSRGAREYEADDEEDYEETFSAYTTDEHAEVEGDRRRRVPCPVCGEQILARAKKCRYCGEVLDNSYFVGVDSRATRTKLERFRKEIHGLGGFWIVIGSLGLLAAIVLGNAPRNNQFDPDILVVLVPLTLFWIAVGVCMCLKQMWAVYTGLVMSYLSLIGNIFLSFNICAIAILVAAVVQGHRVIKWASELKALGVPINTKLD
ncbi:zinc ribbon domain-containing protein [Thalassoroseus pseudoceratinae]|uniref:hypothetical protein n=1 Tax=Thalassoroseus pseudoceratinae TaxID=2713176 RepID=UPI00141FFA0C|nr:hypothetical protein [Thalassoroseus pseudoceratinae]